MLSEAKHPATANGEIVLPELWMRFGDSWILWSTQNDIFDRTLLAKILPTAGDFNGYLREAK